jgi:hypothetical protein
MSLKTIHVFLGFRSASVCGLFGLSSFIFIFPLLTFTFQISLYGLHQIECFTVFMFACQFCLMLKCNVTFGFLISENFILSSRTSEKNNDSFILNVQMEST